MSNEESDPEVMKPGEMSWKDFLESCPPGEPKIVTDVYFNPPNWTNPPVETFAVGQPELHLYCSSEKCGDLRYFGPSSLVEVPTVRPPAEIFLHYACKNCGGSPRTYAIEFNRVVFRVPPVARVVKVGELPRSGERIPTKVVSLIGPDRDLFLKGKRSEDQGLGIGAFSYYRRVVENQKNRLFDEIIRATAKLNPPDAQEIIRSLEAAKGETQFTKAIEVIKIAIPQQLLINGRNPLRLLHSALSEGLHDLPEGVCLEMAKDVRHVLIALAERLAQALKDHAELNAAVSRLSQPRGN